MYLSGARNLAGGRGYASYALQPITEYPFGFSATLALGAKVGIDPGDGARWLNALAFGALVALTFVLARRHLRHLWLAVGAALAVAWAAPLLGVFTEAWSEPVFCVLAVALVLVLEQLLADRERALGWLVAAALLASVGFTLRYAGVALLALPVLVIGVATRRDGWRTAMARTLTYLALAAVLPAWVIGRNLADGSSVFGPRASSIETLDGVSHSLLVTIRSWTLAGGDVSSALGWLVLVAAVAVVALGVAAAVAGRPSADRAGRDLARAPGRTRGWVRRVRRRQRARDEHQRDRHAAALARLCPRGRALPPGRRPPRRGEQRWAPPVAGRLLRGDGRRVAGRLVGRVCRPRAPGRHRGPGLRRAVLGRFLVRRRLPARCLAAPACTATMPTACTGRPGGSPSTTAPPPCPTARRAPSASSARSASLCATPGRRCTSCGCDRTPGPTWSRRSSSPSSGLHLSVRSRTGDTTVYAVRG